MTHSPEDVLAATLHFLKESDVTKFEASPIVLHPIVYEWRQEKAASLLESFPFDTRDYFPFSDILEEALDALQFSGYLERTNPKGVFFEIRPQITSLFERIKAGFSEEELGVVREMAEAIGGTAKTRQ